MKKGAFVSYEDYVALGQKLVEMADRLETMHGIAPGTTAKWAFDMEDTQFEIVMKVVAK